ncbi:MAG TPA: hypothetical protein DHW41_05405 [Bacteroides ovatus]|jgi:hypothetical protein|nr:hypothetical protein [Bacteroides ovatus]
MWAYGCLRVGSNTPARGLNKTEPLLKVNMAKGTGVKHFCFQECFQQKSPMKRGFFKELKAEGGFYSNS